MCENAKNSMVIVTGADFILADTWYFKGINRFAPKKMIDYDRDTRYRSTQVANEITFVFDMTTAKTFDSFAIMDIKPSLLR